MHAVSTCTNVIILAVLSTSLKHSFDQRRSAAWLDTDVLLVRAPNINNRELYILAISFHGAGSVILVLRSQTLLQNGSEIVWLCETMVILLRGLYTAMAFSIGGSINLQNCIFCHCNFNNSRSARNVIFGPVNMGNSQF